MIGKDFKFEGKWLVIAFLILLFWFLATEAEAQTEIEVGATNLSGDWAGGSLVLSETIGKWSFGGGYVSEQFVKTCERIDCENDIDPNIFFQIHRVVKRNRWELGIGPSYFQNTNRALGKQLTWGLSVGYRWKRVAFRFRHYSNAGSGRPNLGQDMLTVGYVF